MNDFGLIQRYLLNQADTDDLRRIDERLSCDDAFAEAFVKLTIQDAALREIAHSQLDGKPLDESQIHVPKLHHTVDGVDGRSGRRTTWIVIAMAASILLGFAGILWVQHADQPIAVIVASENAAWVSDLPTSNGSSLSAGELTLVSGIATLRFHSGVTMILEAPARLTLLTDMNAHLALGAAVVDVPESAIGFTVTTPSGDAIDLGTRFAVSIDETTEASEFEVLEGSLSVGATNLPDRVTLVDNEVATVKRDSITNLDRNDNDTEQIHQESLPTVRLKPRGKAASFIRRNKEPQRHRKSILLVTSSLSAVNYDRKLVVSFDTSHTELNKIQAVRFRLNQINSELGLACRLPKQNVFSVYGLVDDSKANWQSSWTWEQSPKPDDGVLLGTFEIPRSRSTGECIVETKQLLQFVKDHQNLPITLIVVRSTTQIGRGGPVRAHAFASDEHPSQVGPRLELELNSSN